MNDVQAETGTRADDHEQRRIPAEPGVWVFLGGDLTIFVVFFIAFLAERARDRELFEISRGTLSLGLGFTNTLVLLTSSLLVVLGANAVRAGMRTPAINMFTAAIGCGLLFTVGKAVEYTHMVRAGHGPVANSFYNYYFILTGIHLFHLIIGIGGLAVLVALARRGGELTRTRRLVLEAGACYWHLVDLLWMMLFPLLYLVS